MDVVISSAADFDLMTTILNFYAPPRCCRRNLVDAFGFLLVGCGRCCCCRGSRLETGRHRDGELVELVRATAEAVGEAVHEGVLFGVEPAGGGVRKVDLCLRISRLLLLLLLLLVHQTRLQVNAVVSESLSWLLKVLLIQLVLLLLLLLRREKDIPGLVGWSVHKRKLTKRDDGRIERGPIGEVVAVTSFAVSVLLLG